MPIPLGILAVAGSGAAGATDAFDWLETQSITSTTATVTFSNLNNYSAYQHLQIRVTSRGSGTTGTTYGAIKVRFNSDTASNYWYHNLRGDGSGVSAEGTSDNGMALERAQAAGGSTADVYGFLIFDVLNFNSTSRKKTLRSMHGTITSSLNVYQTSGFWNNTNAVTSITLVPTYSFRAGSRISIYGLKG
jgi:hypothetical protein